MNRRGIDLRGDIHVAQIEHAGGQAQAANVAHQGDVRVIDGNGQFLLLLAGGGYRGLCQNGACGQPSGQRRPEDELQCGVGFHHDSPSRLRNQFAASRKHSAYRLWARKDSRGRPFRTSAKRFLR